MSLFRPSEDFVGEASYRMLPFRFRRISSGAQVLVTNDAGDYVVLDRSTFSRFAAGELTPADTTFWDLEGRHFLSRAGASLPIKQLAVKLRTRKSFIFEGPALHIFVVTLRCDHSCGYCQVSRQLADADGSVAFDMTLTDAEAGVRHVLRSPARAVTVEFQGGEPLLAFQTIRFVIERLSEAAPASGKQISFVIATTMHHLDDDKLAFCRRYGVTLSTSLDGPQELHNRNRPLSGRDGHERTIAALAKARAALGDGAVAALTTITRRSLDKPEAIIDVYKDLGFRSIFLRPLSPYGFAARHREPEYTVEEFLTFYMRALDYLIQINLDGYHLDETYVTLLLRNILTPFPNGYVDLRSPGGAGFGVLIYNYDGRVFPSDEARMLVEMGDDSFVLGHVSDSYESLFEASAMRLLASAAIAESIPQCTDCAYLPYCGADPIDAYARQGDVVGHRPTSFFCRKQLGLFDWLFRKIDSGDDRVIAVFLSWVTGHPPRNRSSG